jgi:ribosomal protein S18 acetylase RimI-like enzyme
MLSADQFPVRAARLADAAAVHDLESRVFTSDRLSLRSIRRLIVANSARVLVSADRNDIAAALAMLYRHGSRHARLYSLAVDPRCRGRGVGSRLLSHALDQARHDGKSEMRLEVRRDNRSAQAFYLRHGFVKTGLREHYYQDGQEALVYALKPLMLRAAVT